MIWISGETNLQAMTMKPYNQNSRIGITAWDIPWDVEKIAFNSDTSLILWGQWYQVGRLEIGLWNLLTKECTRLIDLDDWTRLNFTEKVTEWNHFLTYSPNKNIFASYFYGGGIKIFNLNHATTLKRLDLICPPNAIALSSDGNTLALEYSPWKQHELLIVNLEQEKDRIDFNKQGKIPCHNQVTKLEFSSDNKFIVIGYCDLSIELWDLEKNMCIQKFERTDFDHSDEDLCLIDMALSPDSKTLAIGFGAWLRGPKDCGIKFINTKHFYIELFNLNENKHIHTFVLSQQVIEDMRGPKSSSYVGLDQEDQRIKSLSFSPNGLHLAIGLSSILNDYMNPDVNGNIIIFTDTLAAAKPTESGITPWKEVFEQN